MVSIHASSTVDHESEIWSDQTKDYTIVTCCLSTKHASLRSMNKD